MNSSKLNRNIYIYLLDIDEISCVIRGDRRYTATLRLTFGSGTNGGKLVSAWKRKINVRNIKMFVGIVSTYFLKKTVKTHSRIAPTAKCHGVCRDIIRYFNHRLLKINYYNYYPESIYFFFCNTRFRRIHEYESSWSQHGCGISNSLPTCDKRWSCVLLLCSTATYTIRFMQIDMCVQLSMVFLRG